MAGKDDEEKLLAELKEALKPDPPDLQRMKESAKELGKNLPKKSES